MIAQAQTPAPDAAAPPWTRVTPDGQPDLQGTWVNFDSTPFEADSQAPSLFGNPVNPPAHWADHDSPLSPTRRSMVVDPPEGRVPVMKWAEERRDYDLAHLEDHYRHETPWVRCITRGVPGGMFPAGYNNGYEIIQIPGYVIIAYEMIHDTRIIPLDGRPHVGAEHSAVERRRARALGRQHARRRDDELQRQRRDRDECRDGAHPRHPA